MCSPFSFVVRAARAGAPRDGYHHRDSLLEPVEFESILGAELVLQSRPRRRDADAFLQRGQRILGEPDAVVAHLEPEHVVVAPGGDVDMSFA